MQIGTVIREYRKKSNMTQEEMAKRLGVTAPAVNKWENGNSMPDIMLLAPIARLLHITLDTLLSFHEELSDEEIRQIIYELDNRLKKGTYEEAYLWVKEKIETYPNCAWLTLQAAQLLDVWRLIKDVAEKEEYEIYIRDCYARILDCGDEAARTGAADALFMFYLRSEEYEKAEECLAYFSVQNPERKRKQAMLYDRMGKISEAYREYEQILFSEYQMVNMVLENMYQLAMKENDTGKAHMFVEKQSSLAKVFEMGKYYESMYRLELAAADKDADTAINAAKEVLGSIDSIYGCMRSALYEHVEFRKPREEFLAELRENISNCLRDERAFEFLKDDKRWQELAGQIHL